MVTVVVAVLLMMATLAQWPDLPATRPVRRLLVDKPAAWLNTLTRRHLIFATLLLVIVITGGEMLAALGPLDMSLILLWDVSAFIDVGVAVTTLAASARITRGWNLLAQWRPIRTSRPRARRRPTARKSGNDDDAHGLPLAA